jgi:hypothetical protein
LPPSSFAHIGVESINNAIIICFIMVSFLSITIQLSGKR